MDMFRSKRTSAHEPLDDEQRPANASPRLPVSASPSSSSRPMPCAQSPPAAAKINVTTTSTYCNDPSHQHIGPVQHGHSNTKKSAIVSVLTGGRLNTPRESSEDRTPNGSNLSVSVWSDKDAEKFGRIRQKSRRERWTRKRIAIVVAVLLAFIIALAVGLAVGLKKKSAGGDSPSSTGSDARPAGSESGTSPGTGTGTESDKPPSPTASVAPSAVPSGFPVGTYSFVTFLDTVKTDCTANAATWSCPPSTVYYSDPQKALTVLNWEISGTPGSYKITSNGQDPTLGTVFQNEKLDLLDTGKDTERYFFQFSRAKAVNMTGSLGDQKGDFECDYSATTITGSLYTKMGKTYPKDTIVVGNAANPVWPYAARIEQSVGGGENIPLCKKKSGEKVTDGLRAQDASTLCSCMYRNWTPPRPNK